MSMGLFSPNSYFSTIVTGNKTVASAGTALQLTTTRTPCLCVMISPMVGNTGNILIGDSAVLGTAGSEKGIVLRKTDSPVVLWVNDLSLIYIDAVTSGDKVSYAYFS